jgi:putative ABC transport system permease protein
VKYLPLIFKNCTRNPRRTALTLLSVAASMALLTLLLTVEDCLSHATQMAAASPRVSVRHKTSFAILLPYAYRAKIEAIPGVVSACPFNWYGGSYRDPREIFPSLGVDPFALRQVWDDRLEATQAEWKSFQSDRMGCMVAPLLANRFGWKVGDTIGLKGRAVPVDLTFHVSGIFSKTMDPLLFVLRRDYLEESLGNPGEVGNYWCRVDRLDRIPEVVEKINALFANATQPAIAETEKTFLEMFMQMMNMFRMAILAVGAAVVASMVLVTANTIAMSVRERMSELGVLRAMGFGRGLILVFVLGEACAIACAGGTAGSMFAWAMCKWSIVMIPGGPVAALLSQARPQLMLLGPFASVALGAVGGIVPALGAVRVSVSHALRQVV